MYILHNIEELLERDKITKSKLAKELEISPSTIYSWWDKGVSTINIATIIKLSEYFEVSIDDLIYRDLSKTYEEYMRIKKKRDKQMIKEISKILEKYDKL